VSFTEAMFEMTEGRTAERRVRRAEREFETLREQFASFERENEKFSPNYQHNQRLNVFLLLKCANKRYKVRMINPLGVSVLVRERNCLREWCEERVGIDSCGKILVCESVPARSWDLSEVKSWNFFN
jgi:hypothetical protein